MSRVVSRVRVWVVLALFVALMYGVLIVRAANNGNITSLIAVTPSATPCSSIEVSVSVEAIDNINNSNIYLEIRDPNTNAVLRSTRLNPPSMDGGDTWNGNWTTDNCGFTVTSPPNYPLTACWSPGNSSTNCNIDSFNTVFATVPTLEGIFGVFAVMLLGIWLWTQRGHIGAG